MEFFPKVDPVQIQPLDLADIRKTNVQNAMAQVGLQDMQEQLMARKAMGDWINQNGGLPQSPDQVQQLAISLSSRGLPLDKAFDMAGKAQAFGMNNLKMGLYRGVTDALGSGGQPQQPQGQAPQMGQTPPIQGSGPAVMGGAPPVSGGQPAPTAASAAGTVPMSGMWEAAQQAGVPELAPALTRFILAESGGNPNAQASTTSARGLGQFTGATRQYIANKYGADAWSSDPKQQMLALAYLAKDSRAQLAKDMGVQEAQVTPEQLYMAHFLGQGGAPKFLNGLAANPNAPALQFASPQAVQANSGIFFGKDNQPRSVQQVYDLIAGKIGGGQMQQGQQPSIQPQGSMAGAANSPMFQKIQAIIKANPASLMLPEFEGLVKGALAVEGFRTPEQQAQINLWLEQQKKGLEAQYAGQIAGAQELGKGRASIQLENEGGAPVSPQGQAMAAGLKAGAEAGARIGVGVDMPIREKTALDTTTQNQRESQAQVLALQKDTLPALEQDAQRYQRLGQIYSLSGVSGLTASGNILTGKVLDTLAPGKFQELQRKATSQLELQKLLNQELAAQVKALGGNHNEMSQDIERLANPNTSLTPQMLREVVGHMMDQMKPRIQHQLLVLGKGNGDPDLTAIHQSSLGLWKPVIDQADALRAGGGAGGIGPEAAGGQGSGQKTQALDSFWK